MKVVAAWSGGKDSAFAVYKAQQQGYTVTSLVTFMHSEKLSNFHGIKTELLDAQAEAVDIPLVKRVTKPNKYEAEFKDALRQLKAEGAEGLVTGDIYEVANHEQGWLERVCGEVGVKPVRPLWQGETLQIFKDFLSAGFEATVVRTKAAILGEDWLGRELNQKFLADILKLGKVDPCGENGEYHTFVTSGPNFKSRIKLLETRKSIRDGFGQLDVVRFEVAPRRS
jgi:uncharacterized protein (TIGR00290 family)